MEKSQSVDWTGVILHILRKIVPDPWRHDGVEMKSWCIFWTHGLWPAVWKHVEHLFNLPQKIRKELHKLTWLESTRFVYSAAPWHIPLFCFTMFHQCHLKELAGYINSQSEAQLFFPGGWCGPWWAYYDFACSIWWKDHVKIPLNPKIVCVKWSKMIPSRCRFFSPAKTVSFYKVGTSNPAEQRLGDLPSEPSVSASAAPVAAASETYVEALNAHCVTKGWEAWNHGKNDEMMAGDLELPEVWSIELPEVEWLNLPGVTWGNCQWTHLTKKKRVWSQWYGAELIFSIH